MLVFQPSIVWVSRFYRRFKAVQIETNLPMQNKIQNERMDILTNFSIGLRKDESVSDRADVSQ